MTLSTPCRLVRGFFHSVWPSAYTCGGAFPPFFKRDDFVPERITYRKNSLYNRRFEQRIRLKELLGMTLRKLVAKAKYFKKELFLRRLTAQPAIAIRRILDLEPGIFWRAAKGKIFLDLPKRQIQREFDFSPD